MSQENGVIRVGRKGTKKFAFGEDGRPFEVDVVVAFQQWINIDEDFRSGYEDRSIPPSQMPTYHHEAVNFCRNLSGEDNLDLTVAEALEFLARLREEYDKLAVFFQPRSQDEQESLDTSQVELQFSEAEI